MFGFGPNEENAKLIVKGLRSENTNLTKEVKGLTKQITDERERHTEVEEARDKSNRKWRQEQDESNRQYLRELENEKEDAVLDAEREAQKKIFAVEDAATKKVREAEAKVGNTDNAVKAAVLKVKEENLDTNTKLEVKVAVAQGETAAANARAEAAESLIETIQDLMESGAENAQTTLELVIGKIAEVKLDKFQVNVDVPAPVMVNGAPQQKNGGDNKPKA